MGENEDVGYHVSITGGILKALEGIDTRNIQIFSGSPRSLSRRLLVNPEGIRNYVRSRGINLFVHAAYVFNISTKSEKTINYLKKEMMITNSIGARGLVIHVGKSKTGPETMKLMIQDVINFIGNEGFESKLLLETPAGQGTELLTDINDFINFVKTIPQLGIVIDTCHVWQCDYDPYEYVIKVWNTFHSIDLIHFNDSKMPRGDRKDIHALPGEGTIPETIMGQVLKFASDHNIPMVIE